MRLNTYAQTVLTLVGSLIAVALPSPHRRTMHQHRVADFMVAAGSYSSLRVRSTDSSLPQTIQLPSTLFMPWVPPLPEEEGGEGEVCDHLLELR